jgi:ATP-dependent Clp protease ATP-binding subunit ClpX
MIHRHRDKESCLIVFVRLRLRNNIIMVGQNGNRKNIGGNHCKNVDVPLAIVDATVLTEAGYVGEDVESILTRLLSSRL